MQYPAGSRSVIISRQYIALLIRLYILLPAEKIILPQRKVIQILTLCRNTESQRSQTGQLDFFLVIEVFQIIFQQPRHHTVHHIQRASGAVNPKRMRTEKLSRSVSRPLHFPDKLSVRSREHQYCIGLIRIEQINPVFPYNWSILPNSERSDVSKGRKRSTFISSELLQVCTLPKSTNSASKQVSPFCEVHPHKAPNNIPTNKITYLYIIIQILPILPPDFQF